MRGTHDLPAGASAWAFENAEAADLRERIQREEALAAQAAFRSLFDHEPKIDIRTPDQVARQAIEEHWHQDRKKV